LHAEADIFPCPSMVKATSQYGNTAILFVCQSDQLFFALSSAFYLVARISVKHAGYLKKQIGYRKRRLKLHGKGFIIPFFLIMHCL
jgi:hypothetical protein